MKNKLIFFFIVCFVSCDKIPGISDIALTPESSHYSEKNNLLIERYTYPNDTIKIGRSSFIITDAWISHNFKKRSYIDINKEYVKFFCTFKDIETNNYFIGYPLESIKNSIRNDAHGFEGIGSKFQHYCFFIEEKNKEKLPDTIKLFINNDNKSSNIKTLSFYKYSSLYK
ncbi:hypothetical protein [Flavobacterium sp.]|uniref:hypothetical protein n=1 Tax=Flavobacterium sp. TaxID=239 RepID=UPI0039E6C78C